MTLLGKKGLSFEKAVAAVQRMMDPKAEVLHNLRLTDIHGHSRQFDVVIKTQAAGHQVLGVIECKDWKRRVGVSTVDAFLTKAKDVNANIILLASKRGFSKKALEKAKHYGIGTISLLPDDPADTGFSVGVQSYATVFYWKTVIIQPQFVRQDPPDLKGVSPKEIRLRGKRVLDWLVRELVTTYAKTEKEDWHSIEITFDKPRRLQIRNQVFLAKGIVFLARRVREYKTKFVQISGTAFFDWNKKKLTIPPSGEITTDSFRADFSDWAAYEGEIPPLGNAFLNLRFTAHLLYADPHAEIIDLMKF